MQMGILVALYFLRRTARKGGSIFLGGGYDLHRNYGMVVILLSFLCNCDNLTRKPEMSVALEASKQSIEIHHEYDARPLIKSYNCY